MEVDENPHLVLQHLGKCCYAWPKRKLDSQRDVRDIFNVVKTLANQHFIPDVLAPADLQLGSSAPAYEEPWCASCTDVTADSSADSRPAYQARALLLFPHISKLQHTCVGGHAQWKMQLACDWHNMQRKSRHRTCLLSP
jgi:hypothetical protein